MKEYMPECLKTALLTNPLVLADAGAAGGIHDRWSLLGQGLKVIGFEPDNRAFDELINTPERVWINAALGQTESVLSLKVTRHQTNTSLLEPNYSLVNKIHQNPSDFDVIQEIPVTSTTLDKASESVGLAINVLKIDTQGTELSILKGASKSLATSLQVVEVEVEFVDLYQGQPLFGDIDSYMRSYGFILFDVGNLTYQKWSGVSDWGGRKGQLISADALYFRKPENLHQINGNSSSMLTSLAHFWAACTVYGYLELGVEATRLLIKTDLLAIEEKNELENFIKKLTFKSGFPAIRGRGRLASVLRRFADKIEPRHHSLWVNPLGNRIS